MFRYILISFIFCAMISSISTQMFCNRQQSHQLFDQIFNYEDMVYGFRENRFWIMKYNEDSDQWTQTAGPLRKSQLFVGMDDNMSFDNIFVIERYDYSCRALLKENKTFKCRNEDIEFNVVDIAFVFSGNKYLTYRRVDELRFEFVDGKYYYVPWGAETYSEKRINQILPAINTSIHGAIVKQSSTGRSPPSVAFLADEALYEYYILDKSTRDYIVRVGFVVDLEKYKDKTKNGGIRYKNNGLFFINGDIIQYTNSYLKDWGLNYWEFFCENMRVTTVNKITGSDKKRSTKKFKEFETFKTRTFRMRTTTPTLIDKSRDDSEDYPSEDLVENTSEDSFDKSSEDSVDSSAEESADSSSKDSVDSSAEESADSSGEESADSSAEESADSSAEESADSSAEESADSSAEGSTDTTDDGSDYSNDGSNELPTIISSDVMNESSEVPEDSGEQMTHPEDYMTDDSAISNIPIRRPGEDSYTPPFPPPNIDDNKIPTDLPDLDITDERSYEPIDDDFFVTLPGYLPGPGPKYEKYSTKRPISEENKKLFLNLSYLLFILTLITSLIVCSFAIYAFITILAQL